MSFEEEFNLLKTSLCYNSETGKFIWLKCKRNGYTGREAGCIQTNGYYYITIKPKIYLAHRLAWLFTYGAWPKNGIDHIDRNKLDNRICNLREADQSKNNANATVRKDNISGYKGVCWDNRHNKWRAGLHINGYNKYLGLFDNIEDARLAYMNAAKETFGEFYRER